MGGNKKRRKIGSMLFQGMMGAGLMYDIHNLTSLVGGSLPTGSESIGSGSGEVSFGNSRDGFSCGHSESYWKEKMAEEIVENGKSSSYYLYKKRLEEAAANAAQWEAR